MFDWLTARLDVVDVSWDRDTKPRLPRPATVDWSPEEEIYPGREDPRVFIVEIRFDRFVTEKPVTVELSWAVEI